MRLTRVERGHPLRTKLMLGLLRGALRGRVPDIVRTMTYRSELFGAPMNAWLHRVMRGPSTWSVGERELFAAFVSRTNRCHF